MTMEDSTEEVSSGRVSRNVPESSNREGIGSDA